MANNLPDLGQITGIAPARYTIAQAKEMVEKGTPEGWKNVDAFLPGSTIRMLSAAAKSKGLHKTVQSALDWITRKYPDIADLGKTSEFVKILPKEEGMRPLGSYDFATGHAQITTHNKIPFLPIYYRRSPKSIMDTVMHELPGHAAQHKGMFDMKPIPPPNLSFSSYLKLSPKVRQMTDFFYADQKKPYWDRFLEQDARKVAADWIKTLTEQGLLK